MASTKIQSAALISIVALAALGGTAAYFLWNRGMQAPEDIRIGVIGDLDMTLGKPAYQGVVLAVEQINAEGGILGRNLTIVAEEDDSETTGDLAVATNALIKLITVDKADYIVASQGVNSLASQDIAADHKKILLSVMGGTIETVQRVSADYDRYKYFFSIYPANDTVIRYNIVSSLTTLKNYTGFTKIALLFNDFPAFKETASYLNSTLPQYGFNVVYSGTVLPSATDFTSYFTQIEESGAEILWASIITQAGSLFVKEWYDRQSPFVVYGILPVVSMSNCWSLTEGKCEYISTNMLPVVAGYPWTNKSLATRAALTQRWGYPPHDLAAVAYDTVRFILSDAIKRAGTTETEAVIKALETTNVETSTARHFGFSSSHETMWNLADPNNPDGFDENYAMFGMTFQWQNGTQVPVCPKKIMDEIGATYKYPPWQGAWTR